MKASASDESGILAEQLAYYRARASEYDEWFLRQGRYDHGEAHRRQWFDEVTAVEHALAAARPAGDVLELACGTGIWTQALGWTAEVQATANFFIYGTAGRPAGTER